MPNVDFERRLLAQRLPNLLDTPDLKRRLLQVKAKLDYQDQDIIRINFLDTFRPELWCIDGLARQLDPLPGQQYSPALLENLPRLPMQFQHLPQGLNFWVLHLQVDSIQGIVDDAYFLKKIRDQIGFGSRHNLDVTIIPSLEGAGVGWMWGGDPCGRPPGSSPSIPQTTMRVIHSSL